jgi:DNA-binding response OmpR family regulator
MHAKCRVLILDDNADVADSLGQVIRLEGHDVRVCYAAADALHTAATFRPDVCILDIGLPQSDGRQVARTLRATYGPGLLLIALTARPMPSDIAADRMTVFDRYLEKPAAMDKLLALLPQPRNEPR